MLNLPVAETLPALSAALSAAANAVLVAPPGAGKTTLVPLALLEEPWAAGGRLLVLSPRRLAARAAAERMAELRGEKVGGLVGYRTRMDTRVSAATRVEVLTEGVFTRLIQADPDLPGVAAVLFDEAHERSLEGDLALALALDSQGALRPDLRLLVMSATLDGARFAALMGGAPVLESAGRMFPVETLYAPRDPVARIEDAMALACRRALAGHEGSVLAFLPGVAEIERTAERIALPPGVELHLLHGQIDPVRQRAAIAPAPPGTRKLVLATSIAETSITIDGVRIVIDSGLARRPRFDRGSGLTRLVTERVSQAAARQRAGRAGRTAPGVCIRLWAEGETAALPPFDPPEMLEADLSGLALDLARWGVRDPAQLRWLDPPPRAGWEAAVADLRSLGALDGAGSITPTGRALADKPYAPRIAAMLVGSEAMGLARLGSEIAVLLSERGLGGREADVELRLAAWRRAGDPRSKQARALVRGRDTAEPPPDAVGRLVALAYPNRVARSRGREGVFQMANGRSARVEPHDPLARAEWLAVGEASGVAEMARILSAAPIERASISALFGDRIVTQARVAFDAATRGVIAEETERLGALTLARRAIERPPADAVTAALLDGVRALGLGALAWSDAARSLRERAVWLRGEGRDAPDLSDDALLATVSDWLGPQLTGLRRVDHLPPIDPAWIADWATQRAIDAAAPERINTPAGTSHAIDYAAPGGPAVHVRVQELFGLADHPRAGGVPLVLHLTSPAHRPIAVTTDLPGFWRGSYASVAREMRGRYPKHPWPDEPWAARATTRTKRAGG
jgi:ATP-dependent helicase HrpB